MSKDLIRTGAITANTSSSSYIKYKNDAIGNTIHPDLVRRASLHPVINEEGAEEDRVFYSLHNDAGQCVYYSSFIELEKSVRSTEIIIPSTGNIHNPPVLSNYPHISGFTPWVEGTTRPTPPPPGGSIWPEPPDPTIIVGPQPFPPPPPIWDDDDDDDDGGTGPGGTTGPGGSTGGGSSSGGGGASKITDFDNYAEALVNGTFATFSRSARASSAPNPYGWTHVEQVSGWKHRRTDMTSAVRAMKGTRRYAGDKVAESYWKLVDATEMFTESWIQSFTGSIDKVTVAKSMFENCKELKTVTIRQSNALHDASYMFTGCDALKEVYMK